MNKATALRYLAVLESRGVAERRNGGLLEQEAARRLDQ